MTTMQNLQMLIYTAVNGVQNTISWTDEKEYDAATKFFNDIGAPITGVHDNDGPTGAVFVYLDDQQKMDAFSEFLKSLAPTGDSK
jgi:hypothetical protein